MRRGRGIHAVAVKATILILVLSIYKFSKRYHPRGFFTLCGLVTWGASVTLRLATALATSCSLLFGTLRTGRVGGSVEQIVTIQNGIPSDKAKEIVKSIKDAKIKAQAQIQSEQVRVQSPKIDELQGDAEERGDGKETGDDDV